MNKFYNFLFCNNKLRSSFLAIVFSLISVSSFASHVVGGSLTYVYNGGSNYTVTLKLYRDCAGATLGNTVTVLVRGYNGATFTPSKDIVLTRVSFAPLAPNLDSCAQAPNPIPCVEEHIYTATVNNLPPNIGGYHLYYQVIARNTGITNINASGNNIGESFYAYIPGSSYIWQENFTLANGTTTDAGTTAWTRTLGATPPGYAQVNNNLFEVQGANNAQATWTSQSINISSYTSGVNLSVSLAEAGNMDVNDSILTYYSLNGGPLVLFPTNGIRTDDFTAAIASATGLIGNTIQIVIRSRYDASSPTSELFRIDNVTVAGNDFVSNSNPTFDLFPPLFLCVGNQFTFDHSATDVDGDSLAYSFYTPYDGDNGTGPLDPTFTNNIVSFFPVVFLPGYTASSPLGGAGLTLDPSTGSLTGIPTLQGQFIVGIRVREYRNGVYLGEVLRDFQFNVINCPPPAQAYITAYGTTNGSLVVCSGSSITFPNNSDVVANNWTWNFGDLTTLTDVSTAQFPSYTYPGPGTYTATMIINAGTSCADTATAVVSVSTPPAAPVAGGNSPICVGSTLNLTASVVAGSTYSWIGPNGFTSTLQNPSIVGATAAATGTYSVVAIKAGCAGPAGTVAVTVSPIPLAPTAGSNTPLCVGAALNLTASAIVGATYSWTGPNSFTSALQNPTIAGATAAASGTYSVSANVAGCTGPVGTTVVSVSPAPATPTAGANTPVCVGSAINLTASAVAGATYNWTGPNGFTSISQNPIIASAVLASAGTYSVAATVAGCVGTAGTIAVVVNAIPATPTPSSNSPICALATLNLSTAAVAGATYSWAGPNGFTSALQNPSIASVTTAATGTYSLTVTVGGCTSSIGTTAITINPAPAAPTAGSNSPICVGSALNLTASNIPTATYAWTGPNAFSSASQNPTIAAATVAASGTYSVVATVAGCPGAVGTVAVTVNPTPTSPTAGSNTPVCVGSAINLTASNIAGATYAWTGPNSFTSTSQNPSVASAVLASAGTYSVVATVSGCPSIAGTIAVVVNPIPAAPTAGSNSPLCVGSTVNLTASAIAGATYAWTGPNGFTSAVQNPSIAGATAAATGTYSVTATVAGCTGAAGTTTVSVAPPPATPTAGGNTPVCVGSAINLTASAVVGATYNWTGPNGFTSTLQNPSIASAVLASGGTYSVTATVSGCAGTAGTTAVVVNAIPTAPTASSNTPICAGATLNLSSSLVAGATYSWTGPNGFTANTQNASIVGATVAATGTYSVTVTVNGCTSAIRTTAVTINPVPIAPTAGSNSPICVGSALNLTASNIVGATYFWTGPNTFSSPLQNPTIAGATVAASGTYSVVATVAGCPGPAGTVVVTVNPAPIAPTAGSNSPLCVGSTLNLAASNIATATYSWTGPNGFTSTSQNPSLASATAAASGTYSIVATVTGCPGPAGTVLVSVAPAPVAPTASSNSPLCIGSTINLTASAVVGATYTWTGPNGFTSAIQNPGIAAATAAASGIYSVTATVAGCQGPAGTTTVSVAPPPSVPTIGSNTPVCTTTPINLTSTAIVGATYSWTGPNGFTSTLQNPAIASAVLASAGTYSLAVTVAGCQGAAVTTAVAVNSTPAMPTITSNAPLCVGQTLNLSTPLVAGATYTWAGPNGFTSGIRTPSILNVTTAEAGTYSLSITSASGCTSPTRTVNIIISNPPSAPTAGSNSAICAGATLNLTASTIAGATYAWTGSNGFTSALQNPSILAATVAATGTYSVTATVGVCTSAQGTVAVVVNPIPTAPTVSSNTPVCASTTLNLTASNIAGATYTWTGPNGFTSSVQNPSIASAALADAGTYSVSVAVAGCPGTAGTTSVIVNPIPSAPTAGSNSPLCEGNTLNLTASTVVGATYAWSGPNGFTSAIQNPSLAGVTLAASGTYSVTSTVLGCTSIAGTSSVIVNSIPAALTASSNTPVCSGTAINLTANTVAGATYSWTGPNSFTSTLQNPIIASSVIANGGTYTLTATVLGCTSPSATTSVTVNATPATPAITSNAPLCVGQTLNLSTPLVAGATYTWAGPNGFTSGIRTPSISGVTTAEAGAYTLSITSASGCTSATRTVNIVISNPPSAPTASSNGPICAGATLNLAASTIAGATYTWTGPNSFASAIQNPSIVAATVAATGTYTVTSTIGVCTSPQGTVAVVVNPIPSTPTAASNSPVCVGSAINLSTVAVAGATYNWSGPNGFTSSTQNPSIASAALADAGTYSLSVTVLACSSAVTTASVMVNPIPSIPTATSNSPLCIGATLNLTASTVTGATYTWTGPNGFTSAVQNPSLVAATAPATGTYSVTATVLGCTSATGTATVSVAPQPAAPTASSNTPLCAGNTLNLSASNITNAVYTWTGPNGFTSSTQYPVFATTVVANTGTYSVTATVDGCQGPAGTTSVTVNAVPALPSASSNSPLCVGQTLNLSTTSIAGATYAWSGPNGFTSGIRNPSISSVTALEAGTYTLSVTVNGCTSPTRTINVVISNPPVAPTLNSNSAICSGSDLVLTASTIAGASYAWSGPNSYTSATQNNIITGATTLASGTYTVVATIGVCVSPQATINVVVNPIPATPTVANNGPLCEGTNLLLDAETIAGATYSWAGPNGFTSSVEDPSVSNVLVADAGTYNVTVTLNSCTSAAGTTSVTVNTIPTSPTASANTPACEGTTLNLNAATITGATYAWSGPNGFTSTLQAPSISNVTAAAAGTYSVTANALGCVSPAGTVDVVVNPIPSAPIASNNTPICEGADVNLDATNIAGATYAWTGPNGFSSLNQNEIITAATSVNAGTYSVTATVNGCTSSVATTIVVINAAPTGAVAAANTPLCVGQTINLTTSFVAGASYAWSGPNGFTSSLQNPSIPSATNAETGTYSLTINSNGCSGATSTIDVTVNSAPLAPVASSDSPVCTTDTLHLFSTTVVGATYAWTGPNSFTSTLQNPFISNVSALAAGTYTVIANNGCAALPATVVVSINTKPSTPIVSNSGPVCLNGDVTISASLLAGGDYNWTGPNGYSSTSQNNTLTGVTIAEAGTYSVTVTLNGCTSIAGTTAVVVNQPAIVDAGLAQTVCANNASALLNGSVSGGSTTGSWSSSGFGTFIPDALTLNATYVPSNADTTAGSVTLTLASTNNGACAIVTSTVAITITDAPVSIAGTDLLICSNNAIANLNGSIMGGTTGATWLTNGTGSFNPTTTDLNAVYTASSSDTIAGVITFTLVTTGNGTCLADSSTMQVTFTGSPSIAAGPNQFKCISSPNATLAGVVSGGGTAAWTSLGDGSFNPNNTTLNATYIPGANDMTAGFATLIITSTNNGTCNSVSDTVRINYTDVATIEAGNNQTVCANNASVLLAATITAGYSATWTSNGTGTFNPATNDLNAVYIPSAADTSAGSVQLTLTTTNSCLVQTDNLVVTITDAPIVNAGLDAVICANVPSATFAGTIGGSATTAEWSTLGTGTFDQAITILNGGYSPSAGDVTSGNVLLILSSTNNGNCNASVDTLVLTITAPPTVFAGNDTSICANTTLQLNAVVTGGSGQAQWTSNGTGTFTTSDVLLNAVYVPSSNDTLNGQVTLTINTINNGGCLPATDDILVAITDAPRVDAGTDQVVCSNANVTLNANITIASGVSWTTIGDGSFTAASSTNTDYIVGVTDVTNASVQLVATSTGNAGCLPVTDTVNVQLINGPLANAGADINLCGGVLLANLSGTVSGSTTTGEWSTLGTGTFAQNITTLNNTYQLSTADTIAGSVTLVLTTTNGGLCGEDTDTLIINISVPASVEAGNDTTVCGSSTVALNGSFAGPMTSVYWASNGDGTFSPDSSVVNAIYTPGAQDILNGNSTIFLNSVGSCLPLIDSIHVTITPGVIVDAGSNQIVCSGATTVNLTGSITGSTTTGDWSTLGTGTFQQSTSTLTNVYVLSTADTIAGTVQLILTSNGGGTCGDSADTLTVTITNSLLVSAGSDTTVCGSNSIVSLNGTSSNALGQIAWTSTGDGTFSPDTSSLIASYVPGSLDSLNGFVQLVLSPLNTCNPINDTINVTINAPIIVEAGANEFICASQTTLVLAGSVTGGTTTGTWTTSGSGSFAPDATTLNAIYTLSTNDSLNGSVELFLTSTNNGVCGVVVDSMTITLTTTAFATAGNDTSVCANNGALALNGIITGGTGEGVWVSNGDGTFNPNDSTLNAMYTPGIQDVLNGTVQLTLAPINACTPTADSLVVTVTPAPTVDAGADVVVCGGLSQVNLSGTINAIPVGAHWTTNGTGTFNPNDSALVASYLPGVTDGDTLMFVLTSSGNGNCNAVTDTMFVYRNAVPVADFYAANVCSGQSVVMQDSSSVSGGAISSWFWQLGNGDTTSVQNPSVNYADAGTYTVTLHIFAGIGCEDSITKTVVVNPLPVADFTILSACDYDSVRFTDASLGSIVSYSWSFGDTTVASTQNAVHLYADSLSFVVSHSVVSDSGCVASKIDTVNLNPKPIAHFISLVSCSASLVSFVDSSSVLNDSIVSYAWDFGDSGTDLVQNPTHTYLTSGTYTTSLVVSSSNGCKDTVSQNINVAQAVVADYTPAGGSFNTNQSITFINQSSGASLYSWNMGDGSSTQTTTDVNYSFTAPGTYAVELIAGTGACADTVVYDFVIATSGYVIPTGFTPNGDGLNDFFYVKGGDFSTYDLRVFNEWGNQIFISNMQTNKWDGTFKGANQPSGTYIYVFIGKTNTGEEVKLQGEINLVR